MRVTTAMVLASIVEPATASSRPGRRRRWQRQINSPAARKAGRRHRLSGVGGPVGGASARRCRPYGKPRPLEGRSPSPDICSNGGVIVLREIGSCMGIETLYDSQKAT